MHVWLDHGNGMGCMESLVSDFSNMSDGVAGRVFCRQCGSVTGNGSKRASILIENWSCCIYERYLDVQEHWIG